MIHPLLFAVGYRTVSVAEGQCVDFLELCASARISYHSVGVLRDGEGQRRVFRLSYSAGFRAVVLGEARGLDVREESRHGIPLLLGKFARRPGVWLGAVIFCVLIATSSGIIWDIRVEGCSKVSEERVEELLRLSGLGVGSKRSELDVDSIENHVLILSDEISWISVNVTGTVAEVEIREAETVPKTPSYAASNLVAERNGIIVGFEEVRGDISVELGEAVSEGQLLVSGAYGSDTSATRFVRSSGSVIALCERSYDIEIPLSFEKKLYTGRKKIKKSLIFFDKEVKFFENGGNSAESCDTIESVRYFELFGLGKLPIGIRTVTYTEYGLQEAELSEELAAEQAIFVLWQRFAADAPEAQLVDKRIRGSVRGDSYVLEATLGTLENIAKEIEIEIEITG